jgi:hypothetical protein
MSGIRTSTSNTGLSKKEKIAELLQKHKPLLEKLGVHNPLYIPKMVFGTPPVIAFFPSELKEKRDIYTEKVSKSYDSEDPERTLYKWKYNPSWEDGPENGGYPTKPFGHSDDVMYLIPFSELEIIELKDPKYDFGIDDPDEDAPIKDLTIRDLAAILTGKPVSHKEWLNKIMRS